MGRGRTTLRENGLKGKERGRKTEKGNVRMREREDGVDEGERGWGG